MTEFSASAPGAEIVDLRDPGIAILFAPRSATILSVLTLGADSQNGKPGECLRERERA